MNVRVSHSGQDIKRFTTNSGYLIGSLERTCPSLCRVSSSVSHGASIGFIWYELAPPSEPNKLSGLKRYFLFVIS
jgi:hypothetical protein